MKLKSGFLLLLIFFVLSGFITCGSNITGSNDDPKPTITKSPEAKNIKLNSADITWETDVMSNSVVKYGTSSGQYTATGKNNIPAKIHVVKIENLQPSTNYYYKVESQNYGGTVTSNQAQFITKKDLSIHLKISWEAYENGNYSEALKFFLDIVEQDSTLADGYNGLGWCYASNAIDSLEKARENFNFANALDSTFNDALAGRGFVLLALKRYSSAVNDFNMVIQNDPNFIFTHNTSINASDVRLGLAEAGFYRQRYSYAQEQVNILAPQNGLDPNNSATWIVDNINFNTYPEALLAWIEKLKSIIG